MESVWYGVGLVRSWSEIELVVGWSRSVMKSV